MPITHPAPFRRNVDHAAPKPSRSISPLADTQYEIDTREVPRYGCYGRPRLKVMVRPSFLPVISGVRDISTKGIGLVCDRLIPPGACLAVLWDYGSPDRWRTLRARVSRASASPRGSWVIGCTFIQPLQLCDVDAFLRQATRRALPAVTTAGTCRAALVVTRFSGSGRPAEAGHYKRPFLQRSTYAMIARIGSAPSTPTNF